ncbi:hydrolase [Actinomadura kijaniata]|uniref:Glycerophosphoryl diester phosphodiesterase n=1 Tax=Actinomadura namibiensis TaxID=182080 RepID=A0A7W3LKP9_ACTNM|nr:glycerophosphodiester phosphodiesterase family protein [Actinomadura namibiensis]MBA8949921.1 glycerophosphoryl diester phosphodiesterase [Actinomadura namibiensis]
MLRRLAPGLTAFTATTALVVLVPADAPAVAAPEARKASPRVTNVAHRGASSGAPENTLAAFRLARSQRADMFELDVQQTKDGKLVLMHDTTLRRTTDVERRYPRRSPWRVRDFTLAEIRRLDAGSWFSRRYRGERVPTLGEALTAMRDSGLGLLLEIKAPHLYPGIERRVASELVRNSSWLRPDPRERHLVVQSFDRSSVRRFHRLLPTVPTGLLAAPRTSELKELSKFTDQINPPYKSVTAAYVKQIHRHGMDVFTWTVDDPAKMRRAVGLGVDGVITNRPAVLYGVLRERSTLLDGVLRRGDAA